MNTTLKKDSITRDVTLITMRMKGHSGHSGYDRLADYMSGKHIAPPSTLSLIDRLIAKCFKRLIEKSGSIWYHRAEFLCELKAAKKWLTSSRKVFHFVYGENSFRYLGKLKKLRPGNRIVCTFHTPPEKFQTIVTNTAFLREVDAIIVMSESQKGFFHELLGHNHVWFVPHGIDVEFFRPDNKLKSRDGHHNCFFVGSHLRDVKTFRQVVQILAQQDPAVRFHILSSPANTLQFNGFTNVQLYSKISEQELLKLYQSSDILALPLIDSTANNSILEALACGLPVVTTELPGTRDYLSDDCALFVPPGDAVAMADAILKLKDDRYRQKLSENSREQALRFDWRVIADQLMDCYSRLWL